jgi:hypothetical protein
MATNPPVRKFRHGRVSAAIWRNEHEGAPFYSCSFETSYKDKSTGEWRDSKSYTLYDVYALMRCACDAAAYLSLPEPTPEEPMEEV